MAGSLAEAACSAADATDWEASPMTSDNEPFLPLAGNPDLDLVLGALARLDGKVRVIVDRFGRPLAGPADMFASFGLRDSTHAQRLHRNHSALDGVVTRLLGVRGTETEIAIIEPDAGAEQILVRAIAVDDDHVCLVLAVPGRNGAPPLRELQVLFGLTPCEARIVMDLMDGCAPQAIAERHHNSVHTIRAHIRQCHRKIGVSTREELFSRVASLCI
jgi:DNA-binding CsgD family transcriptional regulator